MSRSYKHKWTSKAGWLALAVGAPVLLKVGSAPMAATDWNVGDVFVGVANGQYDVFDNNGVFKETIDTGVGGFTTGCAFNPDLTKLYTTAFGAGRVVVFDNAQPHGILNVINPTVQGGSAPESIVFRADGSFLVGHASGDADVQEYDATDAFVQKFNVTTENVGSDWIELAADQQTLFYTSEGTTVFRFDVGANAQLADFSNALVQGFALRLLPPGDGTGGLLVANSLNIARLDAAGNVAQTYDAPGENNWFALNLDPNGTSFWSGDFGTDNFYRFNIATGAIEVGPINVGSGFTLFGICVKGELTAAQELIVPLDVKPQSCRNPINTKKRGVLPVAILGTDTFDVTQVDVSTVQLEGVSPLRSALQDVATPFVDFAEPREEPLDPFACTTEGPDGFLDLTLKFDTQEVLAALGAVSDGDVLLLSIMGQLLDGTAFSGNDVIVILD